MNLQNDPFVRAASFIGRVSGSPVLDLGPLDGIYRTFEHRFVPSKFHMLGTVSRDKELRLVLVRGAPEIFKQGMEDLVHAVYSGTSLADFFRENIFSFLIISNQEGRGGHRLHTGRICAILAFDITPSLAIYVYYVAVSNGLNGTPRGVDGRRGYERVGLGSLLLYAIQRVDGLSAEPTESISCHVAMEGEQSIRLFYDYHKFVAQNIPRELVLEIPALGDFNVKMRSLYADGEAQLLCLGLANMSDDPFGVVKEIFSESIVIPQLITLCQVPTQELDGGGDVIEDSTQGGDMTSNSETEAAVVAVHPDLDSFAFCTQDPADFIFFGGADSYQIEFCPPNIQVHNKKSRLKIHLNRRLGFDIRYTSGEKVEGGISLEHMKNIRIAKVTTRLATLFLNMYFLEKGEVAKYASACENEYAAVLVAAHNYVLKHHSSMNVYHEAFDNQNDRESGLFFSDLLGNASLMQMQQRKSAKRKRATSSHSFDLPGEFACIYLKLLCEAIQLIGDTSADGAFYLDVKDIDHRWDWCEEEPQVVFERLRFAARNMHSSKYFVLDAAGCKNNWRYMPNFVVKFTASDLMDERYVNRELSSQVKEISAEIRRRLVYDDFHGNASCAPPDPSTFILYDIGQKIFLLNTEYQPVLDAKEVNRLMGKAAKVTVSQAAEYQAWLYSADVGQPPEWLEDTETVEGTMEEMEGELGLDVFDVEEERMEDFLEPAQISETQRVPPMARYAKFGSAHTFSNYHLSKKIAIEPHVHGENDIAYIFKPRVQTKATNILQMYHPKLKSMLEVPTHKPIASRLRELPTVFEELLSPMAVAVNGKTENIVDEVRYQAGALGKLLDNWITRLESLPLTSCRFEATYRLIPGWSGQPDPPFAGGVCILNAVRAVKSKDIAASMRRLYSHCITPLKHTVSLPDQQLMSLSANLQPETKTALVAMAETALHLAGLRHARYGGVLHNCYSGNHEFYNKHFFTVDPSKIVPVSTEDGLKTGLEFGVQKDLLGGWVGKRSGMVMAGGEEHVVGAGPEEGSADFWHSTLKAHLPVALLGRGITSRLRNGKEYHHTARYIYIYFLQAVDTNNANVNPFFDQINYAAFATATPRTVGLLLRRVATVVEILYRIELSELVVGNLKTKLKNTEQLIGYGKKEWKEVSQKLSRVRGLNDFQGFIREFPFWAVGAGTIWSSDGTTVAHPALSHKKAHGSGPRFLMSKIAGLESLDYSQVRSLARRHSSGWDKSPVVAALNVFSELALPITKVHPGVLEEYGGNPFESLDALSISISEAFLAGLEGRLGPPLIWQTNPSRQTSEYYLLQYSHRLTPTVSPSTLTTQPRTILMPARDYTNAYLFYCPANKRHRYVIEQEKKVEEAWNDEQGGNGIVFPDFSTLPVPSDQGHLILLIRARLVLLLRSMLGGEQNSTLEEALNEVTGGLLRSLFPSKVTMQNMKTDLSSKLHWNDWVLTRKRGIRWTTFQEARGRVSENLVAAFDLAMLYMRKELLVFMDNYQGSSGESNILPEGDWSCASIFNVMDDSGIPGRLQQIQVTMISKEQIRVATEASFMLSRYGIFTAEASSLFQIVRGMVHQILSLVWNGQLPIAKAYDVIDQLSPRRKYGSRLSIPQTANEVEKW